MRHAILLIVAAVLLFGGGRSFAADGRTVGEYSFIPTSQVRDPFITTHFSSLTGASYAPDTDLPPIIVPSTPPDTIAAPSGEYLFILLQAEYQHAFGQRATVRASYSGASRVGTTGEALLSQGLSALFGFELGTTIALWNPDRFLLSALVDASYSKAMVVDVLGFADDVANDEPASLLLAEDRTLITPGLALAWAFNEWSGLTAAGNIGATNGSQTGSNTAWRASVAASADFAQRGQAPVGVLGSFEANSTPELAGDDTATSTTVGLEVVYTGREELVVGGQLTWSDVPLPYGDRSANATSLSLVFRYFF